MAREPLSIRGYAKHRGVNESSVRKAIATGRITLRADGKIDVQAADKSWARTTDVSKPLNSVTGNPTHRQEIPGQKTPMGAETDGASRSSVDPRLAELRQSLAATHAARSALALQRDRMELDRDMGKLVDADAVKALAFANNRKARDMVMSLEDRINNELDMQPRAIVREVLRRVSREICDEIARAVAVPAVKE